MSIFDFERGPSFTVVCVVIGIVVLSLVITGIIGYCRDVKDLKKQDSEEQDTD